MNLFTAKKNISSRYATSWIIGTTTSFQRGASNSARVYQLPKAIIFTFIYIHRTQNGPKKTSIEHSISAKHVLRNERNSLKIPGNMNKSPRRYILRRSQYRNFHNILLSFVHIPVYSLVVIEHNWIFFRMFEVVSRIIYYDSGTFVCPAVIVFLFFFLWELSMKPLLRFLVHVRKHQFRLMNGIKKRERENKLRRAP